jgi:hypothetical protein
MVSAIKAPRPAYVALLGSCVRRCVVLKWTGTGHGPLRGTLTPLQFCFSHINCSECAHVQRVRTHVHFVFHRGYQRFPASAEERSSPSTAVVSHRSGTLSRGLASTFGGLRQTREIGLDLRAAGVALAPAPEAQHTSADASGERIQTQRATWSWPHHLSLPLGMGQGTGAPTHARLVIVGCCVVDSPRIIPRRPHTVKRVI